MNKNQFTLYLLKEILSGANPLRYRVYVGPGSRTLCTRPLNVALACYGSWNWGAVKYDVRRLLQNLQ